MLMRKIVMKRVKCLILFATETGKSKEFAFLLNNKFKQAFNVKVIFI